MATSDTARLDTVASAAVHLALRNRTSIARCGTVADAHAGRPNRFHQCDGGSSRFSNLSSSDHKHNNRGGRIDIRRKIPETPL